MRQRIQAIPEEIREWFAPGRDPYRPLAAHILGKPAGDITREERQRVKQVVWLFFTFRAPDILTSLIQGEEEEDVV